MPHTRPSQQMTDLQKALIVFNLAIISCAASAMRIKKLCKPTRRRRTWTREILRRRSPEGTHNLLIPQLLSDGFHYNNFLRMDKESFEYLLSLVEPVLVRVDTKMRRAITVSERLAVTLRYLATGINIS